MGTFGSPGSGGDEPPAKATIIDIDASHPGTEVVFDSWTGGAHCCSEIFIASPGTGADWVFRQVGEFDGGIKLADNDGDGVFEIVTRNDVFNYAFGCYACSVAPLKILVMENGAVRDASGDARFIDVHRDYLGEFQAIVDKDDGRLENGFLAGWVAMKILIGEGEEAWQTMLKRHDRRDDWGLVTCRSPEPDQSCKPENRITHTFPEALGVFLNENGYVY